MSFINICRDNTDPFYRYKMPPIQSKTEGRGNGIKTAIMNLAEVSRALGRPPSYVVKFFGYELGAQTNINEEQDRYLVNGAHDTSELQDSLDGFINKFVLCGSCKNPETEIQIKGKDTLQRDCKACGKITMIDLKHKLSSYILKNPPASSKKGKKSATATANVVGGGKSITDIALGQARKETSGDGNDDDDDDVLTQKINAEAAELGDVVEVKDDEWAVDMSEEAIAARARELEELSLTGAEFKFNELGEWLLKESESGKENLPSDIEIYKRIVELEIGEKPQTVQVLAQTLFDKNILEQIEPHVGLLAKLIDDKPEFQVALLGGLERFLGLDEPSLISKVPQILLALYNKDLLSELEIIKWSSKVSKKYVPKDVSKTVRRAAKPFAKWLQEADEESDDDDE